MGKQTTSVLKQKLLVIDDDAGTFDIVEASLAPEFEIRRESHLAKAVQTAESEQPHVIILRLDAGIDAGHEVLRQLRAHPILSVVPVIALQSDTSEEARRMATREGACALLKTPTTSLQAVSLGDEIREILQGLNVEIKSSDSSRIVQLTYSSAEKMKQMHLRIQREVTLGSRVIVLSPLVGRQFAQRFTDVREWIDEGKVIYLEIKPLLPAKMEYMEDLTTILRDIEKIVELGARDVLLVDEPEALLLPQTGQPNTARIHAFERSVARVFQGVYYFCRRPAGPTLQQSINVMTQALVGNI